MKQKISKLKGEVHIDESLFGGVAQGKRGWGAENKTCVFGMIERDGRVVTVVVKDRKARTLLPIIQKHVSTNAIVHTDKFKVYRQLTRLGYAHCVKDDRGIINTNAIEGYWGNLKKHIRGTHTSVRPDYLQYYLDEYAFRHNHRNKIGLFDIMLNRAINT